MKTVTLGKADVPRLPNGVLLTIVAPCLVVVALVATSEVWRLVAGRPLWWSSRNLTLSEAILLKDQGEMARQLLEGADPNARYAVVDVARPGQRERLTPIEAAVATREAYMVELAIGYGAAVDETNALALQCLARSAGANDVAVYLSRVRPTSGSCERRALPGR